MMMRVLKMAAMTAVLAFGVTAMAGQVTINHSGGTLTCNLPATGGITFSDTSIVSISCTDNFGGTTTCTNQRPTVSVASPPTSATVGTQVSATYSATDPEGQALTVTPNLGSINGSTWTWTPTVAGTQAVTLTASDGQTCNNAASTSFSLNVTGGGTVPGVQAELLTPIPPGQVTAPVRALAALGTKYYYFVLPGPEAGGKSQYYVQVSMGSWDWSTDQDMIIKYNEMPTEADFVPGFRLKSGPTVWYKRATETCFTTGSTASNEMVQMFNVPPGTYYIMVQNRCSGQGRFSLYYGAY